MGVNHMYRVHFCLCTMVTPDCHDVTISNGLIILDVYSICEEAIILPLPDALPHGRLSFAVSFLDDDVYLKSFRDTTLSSSRVHSAPHPSIPICSLGRRSRYFFPKIGLWPYLQLVRY